MVTTDTTTNGSTRCADCGQVTLDYAHHRRVDCPATERLATTVRIASIRLNQAHDTAVGPHPGIGSPGMAAHSAWCGLVYDFWRIASNAAHGVLRNAA